MRQNIYTPLALLTLAGLVWLYRRHRESLRRQIAPVLLAGFALGGFWLTREESVWLLPAVGLLVLGRLLVQGRTPGGRRRWPTLLLSLGILGTAAALPSLVISTLNARHYGWFGTVEFRATEFKAAYGALTRPLVGPDLAQVPVTRQMREAAYEISPAFARLRPHLEGPVGDHWAEKDRFPAAERQILGGWFVWALRDAMAEAGLAPDAGSALRHYQLIADEINAACEAGLVPARPRRQGFAPPLSLNLLRPLIKEGTTYGHYFITFRGFTAHAPDSVGDYAELKAFRDYVGTRLSHAPRSPDPQPAEQQQWDDWKVRQLETAGGRLGQALMWLGPLLLLVGMVRAGESLIDRRLSFPLGLAGALLAATGAYLAINVLVQVTSFYNMSPAAMAAAYPLYLAALGAILIDACRSWWRPGAVPVRTGEPSGSPPTPGLIGGMAAAAALLVWAGRLAQIHLFAGDVPHNDQWVIEAEQIILPWLEGTLRPWMFFIPHFEHLPVWTRLLAWSQVALTGRWDPLVQVTVNSLLYAGFVALVMTWAGRWMRPAAVGGLALLFIFGGGLPHTWENSTWGFQSQFPLALLFLWLHCLGAIEYPPGSRGWWWAQAAALAGIFTLASMWLTPLVVVLSWLWTGGNRRWRDHTVPLLVAAAGALALVLIHWRQADGGAFAQVASDPRHFLHASLHLLGWPSLLPGAAGIVLLPWIIHALRLRRQADTTTVDRLIFSLGLWNVAQALALASTRAGDTHGFVSRYGDVLFVGVLAGALALTRLVPRQGRRRAPWLALAVVWAVMVAGGLVHNSIEGHAHYFHQHAVQNAEIRRSAVQHYLTTGDAHLLEDTQTRWVLYQHAELVTRLLDHPEFVALLPTSVNPDSPPVWSGRLARFLPGQWHAFLVAGGLLLGLALAWARWQRVAPTSLPLLPNPPNPWPWRIAAGVAGSALLLMLAWSNPFAFDREQRFRQALGGDRALTDLSFEFVGESPFGNERLQGAAPILPEVLRNQFYGTAPAGPELTCTVVSSRFELTHPWLVVPYAGYPVGHGNGLRIRVLPSEGQPAVEEIGSPGPNSESSEFWVVDVRAYQGRQARLVLYDGRTDTEAWVAAAPPVPTQDPTLADTLARGLQQEQHAASHTSLGVIALISSCCALLAWGRWHHRRRARET
jgi:hypothetical protein